MGRRGNEGWSYDELLPYFVRSERNPSFRIATTAHAGRFRIRSRAANPLVERYLAAAQEIGIPFNSDFNGETQEGCGRLQATIANDARCSAADAYLHPSRARPNLSGADARQ